MIPFYNQRSRARQTAAEAVDFLRERFGDRAELIVVDDGSAPGQRVEGGDLPPEAILVQQPENTGKGGAIRSGVARARGEYIIFTDSDLPFSLEPLSTTLAWLRDGSDVVIGDRLHPDSVCATEVTPLRQLSSVVYTFLVKRVLGLDFPDTQCGYKGYLAPVAKALYSRLETTSFAFEAELLIRAQKAGYRIRRQPLRLMNNEETSVRLSRHAPRMFADTLRIGWRARRGAYG